MEIAAAYLSEGGKYVDVFSALTGGMLSHLPDRLISFLHIVPRNMQHFKFPFSSIALWRNTSSCPWFFIPNLDLLQGKEEKGNWGSPAGSGAHLKLITWTDISRAQILNSPVLPFSGVCQLTLSVTVSHQTAVSWGGERAEWARQSLCEGIWARPANVRGGVAGRHMAPQHGVSQLHGHVAWMWQWLFTSIDSEHAHLA